MSSRLAFILLIALVACGGKQKPAPAAPPPANEPVAEPATPAEHAEPATPTATKRPSTVTDEMVAVAEDMVAAMEGMGKDLAAAGTDCSKAAMAIHNGVNSMKPIAERAKPFKDVNDAESEAWFKATYMPRMMTAMNPMMQVAQACGTDKEFTAAIQEMSELDM